MFTGLIIDVGTLTTIRHDTHGTRVRIESKLDPKVVVEGASIAVNGVCLTVKEPEGSNFEADLSLETLRRTTFTDLSADTKVNLEPALALGSSMGGHMVQGHVDGLGEVVGIEPAGEFREITWRLAESQMAEVVEEDEEELEADDVEAMVKARRRGSLKDNEKRARQWYREQVEALQALLTR